MKVISVRQPWAALLLLDHPGRKSVENRKWPTRYRGWVRIHAAKTPATKSEFEAAQRMAREARLYLPVDGIQLKYGGIIGMCYLSDCVRFSRSPWFVGPYGFVLTDPYPLPFERCAGQLGLYDYGSFNLKHGEPQRNDL